MEPTSSPDNTRPSRGLARFWPVHRDEDDETVADETPAEPVARSSETQMVALGSRRGAEAGSFELGPLAPAGPGTGPAQPLSPVASTANQGRGPDNPPPPGEQPPGLSSPGGAPLTGGSASAPAGGSGRSLPPAGGQRGARDRDPDHSGASEDGEEAAQAVESARSNPWERDFGGFGLGGRNGRFLFGGRNPAEQRPTVNGHGAETNGRPTVPDAATSTVDDPAHGPTAHRASDSDENGRDEMNGRAGVPGFGTLGESGPAESGEPDLSAAGRRRDPGDTPAAEPRRQAAGWASVPTSTNPVVSPTSGAPAAPTSGAPSAAAPTSAAPAPKATPSAPVSGGFGGPPSYLPGLPDPAAGPVSGVPAPRAGAAVGVPTPAPAGRSATTRADPPAAEEPEEPRPAASAGQVSITFGSEPPEPPAAEPRRSFQDRTPAPRRSASLEDAEPVRRGRRAAPDEPATDDAPLRPGDVAAGHIAFWDDDATRHFRAAWHEVKAEFVDDPVTALTRAHDLLTEAVNELTEAMLAERDELDPLRGNGTPDTESMRMAMRGYREFLERILAL